MKVLLIRPVTDESVVLNVVPPIGLGYLATALRRVNAEVGLVDCVLRRFKHQDLQKHIREFRPDVIGFSMFSHDVPSVMKSTRLIKEESPNVKIVLGGAHPSAMPQETLRTIKEADFSFKGEGEQGLPKLVMHLIKENSIDLSDIPGLSWREGEGIISNPQVFCEDLDGFGFPSWDLHDPRIYPPAPQGMVFKRLPIAPIVITRGCPFKCTFCAGHTVTGKRIRFRSVTNVLAEIDYLYHSYGVREIHILDDNFTLQRQFVKDFCNGLINTKMDISWCCPNGIRMDSIDEEVLLLMKRAGCHYISVGIESGSPMTLRRMKKGLTREKIENQIKVIRKSGFPVNGFFILGYPGETKQDIEMTIEFSKALGLTRAAFFNFMPLPGSEIYDDLLRNGELGGSSWNNMFEAYVSYSPKGISKNELKSLQRRAHLEFYLRPRILLRLILSIKNLIQFKFIVKRAIAYLFRRH